MHIRLTAFDTINMGSIRQKDIKTDKESLLEFATSHSPKEIMSLLDYSVRVQNIEEYEVFSGSSKSTVKVEAESVVLEIRTEKGLVKILVQEATQL